MEFKEWETFYVIMGTAAGALIGLQFIVLTLIAQSSQHTKADAGAAFSTPTIVHFSSVLLISGIVSVPWEDQDNLFRLLSLAGGLGLIYMAIVFRRMKKQHSYSPDIEDWLCHFVFPTLLYLVLIGLLVFGHYNGYAIALTIMGLLATGIHNTWDALTFHVFQQRGKI